MLQVTFGADDNHRRRASFLSPASPHRRRGEREQLADGTSCFVHSLLGEPGESTSSPERVGEPEERMTNGRDEECSGIVQSRQLTKKQLSDMAWNVRTLSRRLGSLKLKLNVKGIFVLTKRDHSLVGMTREVTRWLLAADREARYIVYLERRLESDKEFDASGLCREEPSAEGRLKYLDLDHVNERSHAIDFIVTLGGDGTVLYASWLFQRVVPPVLSFSLGTLGFLTKFDFDDYRDTLEMAFRDGITVSLRLRLECTTMRSKSRSATASGSRDLVEELIGEDSKHDITHRPERTFQVLNEIVVDRGPNPSRFPSPCVPFSLGIGNANIAASAFSSHVVTRNIWR